MKSGNQGLSSEEGDGSDSPTPATLSTLHRKDLDFTEEMWTVLKGKKVDLAEEVYEAIILSKSCAL